MADGWPTQAADTVQRVVGVVRDKTVVPAQRASRAIVHGLLSAFFAGAAIVLLVIGAFRGLVILTDEVWMAYAICGGILVVAGGLCWSLRTPRQKKRKKEEEE